METRDLSLFSGIELRGEADVYITQGDIQDVRIEAEEKSLASIHTSVRNKALLIEADEFHNSNNSIAVHITVKDLSLMEVTGSGSLTSINPLNCESLTLRLSGSGRINASVLSKSLKASLAGTGSIDLFGKTLDSDIRLTGSGNVNAQHLQTISSSVSIGGDGFCKLNVTDELLANITGVGNVYFVNEPSIIRSRISGTGDVLKI